MWEEVINKSNKHKIKKLDSTHSYIQSIQFPVLQDHTKLAYLRAPNLPLETIGEIF